MIVSDIINKLPDNVTDLWMVMSAEQANTVESAFDGSRIALRPVLLSDGTFTLCCDILAEVGKGGIYAEAFDKFRAAIVSCTVLRHGDLPWIPQPDEDEDRAIGDVYDPNTGAITKPEPPSQDEP